MISQWASEWVPLMVFAALVSQGVVVLLTSRLGQLALDMPNHRSMHMIPVPRTGGWALLMGVLLALLLSPIGLSLPIIIAFTLLLIVSSIDDFHHVSARVRLVVQIIAATLLLSALPATLVWWWYPMLLISAVWVINLYNFMDGMDGLAGSMTVVGFSLLGVICAFRGYGELAGVCATVVASTLVFLRYNWPTARIFLGDNGSTLIGLAVVAVSLAGWQQGAFELIIPIVLFSPFWLDASLTLMRRILAGERWWEPHQQHYFQRSALRVGVKKTLYRELAMMLVAGAVSVLLVIFKVG